MFERPARTQHELAQYGVAALQFEKNGYRVGEPASEIGEACMPRGQPREERDRFLDARAVQQHEDARAIDAGDRLGR